jgi:hypothetical protein
MAAPGIAIDEGPSPWTPLRFLLTAPWFAALAGLVLLWAGAPALESRWSPALLSATHLVTLGFMTMAMVGALLQLMPVAAAALVPRSALVAGLAHPLLAAGTLLLAGGVWLGYAPSIRAAAALLASAFAAFLLPAVWALWRARVREPMARIIALALAALMATVALGLTLAAMLGWGLPVAVVKVVKLHAAWGLIGWTTVLVAGIAQQVVPMFQGTPPYPRLLSRWFAPALLAALCIWSAASWLDAGGLAALAACAMVLVTLAFSLATLSLQRRSRRPAHDATFLSWRAGMLSLAAASLCAFAAPHLDSDADRYAVLTGMLAVAGFALSVINGMLYKIVPFLVWLHLQHAVGGRVPHVRLILPDAPARRHVWLHLAAVAALCAAALWPRWLVHPAAALFVASNAALGWMLLRACRWVAWRPQGV